MNRSIAAALLTASSLAIKLETQEQIVNNTQERMYVLVSTDGLDQEEAKWACEAAGGQLAIIDSPEENARAVEAFQSQTNLAWIGAIRTEAMAGPEGFAWQSGSEWVYSNWQSGEPNNGHDNEDCTELGWFGDKGLWADDKCFNERAPLCSFEPAPVVVIEPTVEYSHKYTLLMDAKRDWAGAQDACIADGGALAVISNQADHEAAQVALQLEGQDKAWLGGYRQEAGAGPEGFAWTDGSEWTFGPWANGEPNDYGSGEDCLQMGYHSIDTWNDMTCSTNYYALCSYWTPVHDDSHDHDDHEEHHDSHDDEDEDHEEEHSHAEIYPETNEDGTPFNVNTPM